jgi:predicted metal-binding membrane protein
MQMAWEAPSLAIIFAMWWVMMIAMMVPAAAPVVLLYARASPAQGIARPHIGPFFAGYLLCWLAFSAIAVALQLFLEQAGVLDGMAMQLTSRWIAGGVLVAAGIYQLTPAKNACLSHCRNPADFLSRHFRPGAAGALRMGLYHGAYCVGCCWLLMALLFVVGIMNLAWIALLTIVVAAEKLLPNGQWLARVGGVLFLAWGALILIFG